jgi:hypothetical protein
MNTTKEEKKTLTKLGRKATMRTLSRCEEYIKQTQTKGAISSTEMELIMSNFEYVKDIATQFKLDPGMVEVVQRLMWEQSLLFLRVIHDYDMQQDRFDNMYHTLFTTFTTLVQEYTFPGTASSMVGIGARILCLSGLVGFYPGCYQVWNQWVDSLIDQMRENNYMFTLSFLQQLACVRKRLDCNMTRRNGNTLRGARKTIDYIVMCVAPLVLVE